MNPKLKRIAGIIGFVILFAVVVYLKTERKINRYSPQKKNTEIIQKQVDFQKQKQKLEYEAALKKQQAKRDSIAKAHRDSMDAKLKETRSILDKLNKEIKEKK